MLTATAKDINSKFQYLGLKSDATRDIYDAANRKMIAIRDKFTMWGFSEGETPGCELVVVGTAKVGSTYVARIGLRVPTGVHELAVIRLTEDTIH